MAIGVDEGLGSVARALRARGVWNDTLLVFLSDNGGVLQAGAPNTPLRGSKSTWLEGGMLLFDDSFEHEVEYEYE